MRRCRAVLADSQLEQLLADLESDRAERKASLSDPEKIRQAICAFANDLPGHQQPGVIFIGANDDGSCANTPITDQMLLSLGAMRSNGKILPFPTMVVQKRMVMGCNLVVVEVEPSLTPPVRLDGRVWIRVGPRRALATPEEERRLVERRRSQDFFFEQEPVTGTSLDDLDLQRFRDEYLPNAVAPDILAANQRTIEHQLAALHLTGRNRTPNRVALLVLGKEPRQWVPGAYVQFLRLDGPELTDPIRHQAEIGGPIPDQIRHLEEILAANISLATDIQVGLVEERNPDYPLSALQQFCRNALLHRTYEATNSPSRVYWFSDRIEIYSPGGLYGQVTPEKFGKAGATDYRNPLLAEAMKVLGFVQRFGMGIPLARKELEKNGNPSPEFYFEATGVLVVIRRAGT